MTGDHWLTLLEAHDRDRPALVDEREEIDYGQLRGEAGQVASVLVERYGSGGFLVVRAESSVRFVVTLLGVMRSGLTPVPVAGDMPAEDIDYIVRKSGAKGVVAPLPRSEFEGREPIDARDASQPAIIMFTSGTTGFPKGVIVSHANLRHSCEAVGEYLDYRRLPSAAVVLPLHYSYALLSQVCAQLVAGGRIALFANLRNPIKFARRVTELGLETFCGVPSTYLALTTLHAMSKLEMPTVRVLCSAGAAMNRGQLEAIKEIFPNATFFNNYGMTEAAPRISFVREDDPRFATATCGRPMRGVEVRVVDPATHAPVADGVQGMLVVRGPNITSGYLNDPELTRDAFTKDGFLISGDIAYLDGGYIHICGRNDDIFNTAGEKVAPLEIERPLNAIPGVEASAVTGIVDAQRGMVPVAFLKLSATLSRRQLMEGLQGHLPAIKIPQRYYEVRGFPLSANGKLRRKELRPDDASYVVREIE